MTGLRHTSSHVSLRHYYINIWRKKLNRGLNHFTPDEIIGTLTDMNFLSIAAEGYMPTYTRNDLTNALHGFAGFRTDKQIVTKKKMRSIIAQIKKAKNNQQMDNIAT